MSAKSKEATSKIEAEKSISELSPASQTESSLDETASTLEAVTPKKIPTSQKTSPIIWGTILTLIVAIVIGATAYTSYQEAQQADYINLNYNIYSESLDKTIETFNNHVDKKVETKELADNINSQLSQTQNLIKQNQASLKNNPPTKAKDLYSQISQQFNKINTFLDKTIILKDLDGCISPQYSEFTKVKDQLKTLSKESKYFDTFPNLQARFETAATLNAVLQSNIDASLACFDTFSKGGFSPNEDLRSKIEKERNIYKSNVENYKEMSQAAKDQDNSRLSQAQKKGGSFFNVYYEINLKTYFITIASSLKEDSKTLENSRKNIQKYKTDIINTL